jgi:hypothetical protein
MTDLSTKQTRILFELSNGKRLLVAEGSSAAFICCEEEFDDPRSGIPALFDDYLRLKETEAISESGRRQAGGLGEVGVYEISASGIESLLETSMRPVDN